MTQPTEDLSTIE